MPKYINPFEKLLVEQGLASPLLMQQNMQNATRLPPSQYGLDPARAPANGSPGAAPPTALAAPGLVEKPKSEPSEFELLQHFLKKSPEQQAMEKEQMSMFQDAIGEQKKGIDASEEALAAYANSPTETDMRPLLSLVDSWTGSNFAKGIKPPTTPEEKQARVAQLQDLIAKRKGDLAKTQGQLLKQAGGGMKPETLMRLLGVQGRADERLLQKTEERIDKDTTKALESMTKMDSTFNQIQQSLASGEVGQIVPMLSQVARNISGEKGVLTDKDIKRTLTRSLKMDWTMVQSYLQSDPRAKVDPRVVEALQILAKRALADTVRVTRIRISRKRKTYGGFTSKSYRRAMAEDGGGTNALNVAEETISTFEKFHGSAGGSGAAAPREFTGEKGEAYKWLQQNPDDPRAESVRKKLGL